MATPTPSPASGSSSSMTLNVNCPFHRPKVNRHLAKCQLDTASSRNQVRANLIDTPTMDNLSNKAAKRLLRELKADLAKSDMKIADLRAKLTDEVKEENELVKSLRLVLKRSSLTGELEQKLATGARNGLRAALADLRDLEGAIKDSVCENNIGANNQPVCEVRK